MGSVTEARVPPGSRTRKSKRADESKPQQRTDSLTLQDFPRLARLREELLSAEPGICIERARHLTDYFQKHGFDERQAVLRQARALSYVLDHLPTPIFDDELIVGSTTRYRLGALLYPEFMAHGIWPELPNITKRKKHPFTITDEEVRHLSKVVFPFWRERTIGGRARRLGDNPRSISIGDRFVFYILSKHNCISHVMPDHTSLVTRGLRELALEAEEKRKAASDDEAREFHEATNVCLEGVMRFAERMATACDTQADSATSTTERTQELREVAEILRRVPAKPAATFHEALQSVWITQVALHQENADVAMSFGRLDQFLAPYYERDLAEGRINPKRAVELLGSFFVKLGDHTPLVPAVGEEFFGGSSTNQAVTVGGMLANGKDGVNALTPVVLKAAEVLALREPNVCARVHAGSTPEYIRSLVESIYATGAAPALFGDEAVIESLTENGLSLEDARDYGVIGCVETNSPGRTMGMTGSIIFNIAAALDLALNDGKHSLSGARVGLSTGQVRDFETFDDLYRAFARQVEALAYLAADGNARLADVHAALHPTPLLSSLIQGTAESGRDVTRGGAKYNSSGIAVVGLADAADSLTALKELVFEDKRLSISEVADALASNFEGHEKTRALLMRRASKYGADNDVADEMAVELVHLMSRAFGREQAPRGGRYHLGYWSITMHAGFGALMGALPNGRKRGETLSSGATPVAGVATQGPTASLASTAKLPAREMANCIATNHKFSRQLLAERSKRDSVSQLVSTFFKRGGMQVQFTVQDRETLLDAQKNPEAHRDLLVRVSGYTAYFCDLNRRMQDEIISRTENEV